MFWQFARGDAGHRRFLKFLKDVDGEPAQQGIVHKASSPASKDAFTFKPLRLAVFAALVSTLTVARVTVNPQDPLPNPAIDMNLKKAVRCYVML